MPFFILHLQEKQREYTSHVKPKVLHLPVGGYMRMIQDIHEQLQVLYLVLDWIRHQIFCILFSSFKF